MIPPHQVLLTERQIAEKVSGLGAEIASDYAGKDIWIVCIACGAIVFVSDLMRRIPNMVYLDVVKVKSYTGTHGGEIRLRDALCFDPAGRDVLVCDDILDRGKTLMFVRDLILAQKPASVRTCVLLDKPSGHPAELHADYCGFTVPDKFVFGYGLDDDKNRFRNLPYIGCR